MITEEKSNAFKEEVETMDEKFETLTEEELTQVTGGADCYYLVKPGDTIPEIARKLGVTMHDLISLNGIKNPDLIVPGQRLKYPG